MCRAGRAGRGCTRYPGGRSWWQIPARLGCSIRAQRESSRPKHLAYLRRPSVVFSKRQTKTMSYLIKLRGKITVACDAGAQEDFGGMRVALGKINGGRVLSGRAVSSRRSVEPGWQLLLRLTMSSILI